MKKYRLTKEMKTIYQKGIKDFGTDVYRIEALVDFADVKAGDKGGWVDSEESLSQEGDCWVYDESYVINSHVNDDVKVYNNSKCNGVCELNGQTEVNNSYLIDTETKGECLILASKIRTAKINESQVKMSTLSSCQPGRLIVNGSTIEESKIEAAMDEIVFINDTFIGDSRVMEAHTIWDSFIRDSYLQKTCVNGSTITDKSILEQSSIDDCTLECVKAEKHDLSCVTLQHTRLVNQEVSFTI